MSTKTLSIVRCTQQQYHPKHVPIVPSQLHHTIGRRNLLLATCASIIVTPMGTPPVSLATPQPTCNPAIDCTKQHHISAYFDMLLQRARDALQLPVNAQLIWYDSRSGRMPPGVPGDPARDTQSSGTGSLLQPGDNRCGPFLRDSPLQPYALCPIPPIPPIPPPATGGAPDGDSVARACCRHMAYAVPYPVFSALPSRSPDTSMVVVSPRLTLLPDPTWQGIIAHELGHCIDFALFGSRYGLRNLSLQAVSNDQGLRTALVQINEVEGDPEVRADDLANNVLLLQHDMRLCYEPMTTLQTLRVGIQPCTSTQQLEHFPHAPYNGSRST